MSVGPRLTVRDEADKIRARRQHVAASRPVSITRNAQDKHHTQLSGRSRSVRRRVAVPVPDAPKSFTLSRNDATMVGIVRASVIRPAARTAPAPVYRMYALQSCAALIWSIRSPFAGTGGSGVVMKFPRYESSGSSTSHERTPPANITPAIRGPMTYPTPMYSGERSRLIVAFGKKLVRANE